MFVGLSFLLENIEHLSTQQWEESGRRSAEKRAAGSGGRVGSNLGKMGLATARCCSYLFIFKSWLQSFNVSYLFIYPHLRIYLI